MNNRVAGLVIAAFLLCGIVLILFLSLDTGRAPTAPVDPMAGGADTSDPAAAALPAGFREYPIGNEVSRNSLKVRAVYLPPIAMADMPTPADDGLLHLEADIVAEAGNRNGFALNGFVPYLRVDYRIEPAAGGPPIESGTMIPMVAQDGLHYGANVLMPRAGDYRLVYKVHPPEASLGRHSDPTTGVDPWWPPFEAVFEWDYPGPPPPAG